MLCVCMCMYGVCVCVCVCGMCVCVCVMKAESKLLKLPKGPSIGSQHNDNISHLLYVDTVLGLYVYFL